MSSLTLGLGAGGGVVGVFAPLAAPFDTETPLGASTALSL